MSDTTKNRIAHIVVNVVYVLLWLLVFKLVKKMYNALKTKVQSIRRRGDIVAAES